MLNQMLNIENLKKYPISVLVPKGVGAVSIQRPFNNAKSGLFTMKKEIWKDITGYEGHYQVSNKGRVKSLQRKSHKKGGNRKKDKILSTATSSNNYLSYRLCRDGKVKTFSAHRLVAKAFISNPKNYPIINHIDFDRSNNNVENIEWCTYSQNTQHSYNAGRMFMAIRGDTKTIQFINDDNKCVYEFETITKAANFFGFSLGYFYNYVKCNIKFRGLTVKTKRNKKC